MFLHLSTLPRSDFPVIHGARKHYQITDLFFFWACALQNSYFFMFYRRMQTLQRARNVGRLSSQISQDGTFVHYPFFVLNISLFVFSFPNSFRLFVCFDILWQLATTHATGTQIVRAKMTLLDAIFCRGNKSSSRSLARFCSFCRRKHRKSTARASRSWKKVTSTCRQVHGRGSFHKRIYKAPARRILAPFFSSELFFAAALSPDRDLLKL